MLESAMRKLLIPLVLAGLFLITLFGVLQVARGQGPGGSTVLQSETLGESRREISAVSSAAPETSAPDEPTIGFIDSPSATCVQPDVTKDECFINWYYLSVSASPNYMITMTVVINEFGPVARTQGFFQTSMYVPYNMNPKGYKVACGAPGAGGDPDWGKAYAYTIRARDSAGLKSANYGTAYCPPFAP
jgi:hypothetical protein